MGRIRIFVIVEMVILFLLAARLLTHHSAFIPAIVIALVFSVLAGRGRLSPAGRIFGLIAGLAWIFIIILILSTGFFWLLLIWPIIWIIFFYRRQQKLQQSGGSTRFQTRPGTMSTQGASMKDVTDSAQDLADTESNEIIDLAELVYHEGGNELQISKSTGNTKIIVPEDVGISLRATTVNGVVKIFDQTPVMDVAHFHYQTADYEQLEKRVSLSVRVVSGNIDLVRG
jgi:predicted membrane protein